MNIEKLDPQILTPDPVLYWGTGKNLALITAIAAATLLSAGLAPYLIVKGIPLPSMLGIGGIALGSVAVVVITSFTIWYKTRVAKIREATRALFDQVITEKNPEKLHELFVKHKLLTDDGIIACGFCSHEFATRIKAILTDTENLDTNIATLETLLDCYLPKTEDRSCFMSEFLEKELDTETRTHFLTHRSENTDSWIAGMMTQIFLPYPERFATYFDLIDEEIKMEVIRNFGFSIIYALEPKEKNPQLLRELVESTFKLIIQIPEFVPLVMRSDEEIQEQLSVAFALSFGEAWKFAAKRDTSSPLLSNIYSLIWPEHRLEAQKRLTLDQKISWILSSHRTRSKIGSSRWTSDMLQQFYGNDFSSIDHDLCQLWIDVLSNENFSDIIPPLKRLLTRSPPEVRDVLCKLFRAEAKRSGNPQYQQFSKSSAPPPKDPPPEDNDASSRARTYYYTLQDVHVALAKLGLDHRGVYTKGEIKKHVSKVHPDKNGNTKAANEKFAAWQSQREIIEAYLEQVGKTKTNQ